MKDPATLDEAYILYKENRFQRKDILRMMIDAIKALQTRIGGVDEAAVDDVRKRVAAMETTIGNALIGAKSDEMRRAILAAPAPRSYGEQIADLNIRDEGEPVGTLARKPGRPKKEAA